MCLLLYDTKNSCPALHMLDTGGGLSPVVWRQGLKASCSIWKQIENECTQSIHIRDQGSSGEAPQDKSDIPLTTPVLLPLCTRFPCCLLCAEQAGRELHNLNTDVKHALHQSTRSQEQQPNLNFTFVYKHAEKTRTSLNMRMKVGARIHIYLPVKTG